MADVKTYTDEQIDYAIANLVGCYGKLDDAITGLGGMSFKRAVWDSRDPMKLYLAQVIEALGRPVPGTLLP